MRTKKSLILKFPTDEQVPSHLIRHFIRGHFDGDGCIHITKRNQARFDITSTNEFCIKLRDTIKSNLGIESGIYFKHGSSITCSLEITGNTVCRKFFDWLYLDSNIHLDRKHDKYLLHFAV